MASPPFNIAQTTPGDTDIVSQFPAAERTYRDVVESWLTVGHNTSGQHKSVSVEMDDTNLTPVADHGTLQVTTNGELFYIDEDNYPSYKLLEVPIGAIIAYATNTISVSRGFLLCDGSAVSRTTYANLFSTIGTTFGVGDNINTFNIPDLRGRAIFGRDNMGGSAANRITAAGAAGITGTTLGAVGGTEDVTLTEDQIPSHVHTMSGTTGNENANHSHTTGVSGNALSVVIGGGGTAAEFGASASGTQSSVHQHLFSGTSSFVGDDQAHSNLPPLMILNYIIKI